MMTSLEKADDFRQRGNHEFQQGNMESAIALYTAGLNAFSVSESESESVSLSVSDDGSDIQMKIVLYCNRAACYYQLQHTYEEALEDATTAYHLSDCTNVKALYRMAKTYLAMRQPQACLEVLEEWQQGHRILQTEESLSLPSSLTQLQQAAQAQLDDEEGLESSSHPLTSIIGHVFPKSKPLSIRDFDTAIHRQPKQSYQSGNAQRNDDNNNNNNTNDHHNGGILGVGNFSEIIMATHIQTQEVFALKILEKKKAAELAKRQHPNVYNEIAMERRVLLARLPAPLLKNQGETLNNQKEGEEEQKVDYHHHRDGRSRIVEMYHVMEDYNNLYYVMKLYPIHGDLWSCLKYRPNNSNNNSNNNGKNNKNLNNKMVGAYPSQVQMWMWQLIDALEYMHSKGIVHRDLKPENIMLDVPYNHVVILDFGTAKDLIYTDLNGPEFVGTPDFMSPEQVMGGAPPSPSKKTTSNTSGATHCTDLWALGAMLYILLTGECPFWSPSPYLTFLKIRRGLLRRNDWIFPSINYESKNSNDFGHDNTLKDTRSMSTAAWDLCQQLVQVNPQQRLGADGFKVDPQTHQLTVCKGYDMIRNHSYFDKIRKMEEPQEQPKNSNANTKPIKKKKKKKTAEPKRQNIIPSLQDYAIRACVELAQQDAIDLDICEKHPPGDGSSHDFTRLSVIQRGQILHILDKLHVFKGGDETRVFQRFFVAAGESKKKNDGVVVGGDNNNNKKEDGSTPLKAKVRPMARNMCGLTQMNDDEFKPQSQRGSQDPYAEKEEPKPTKIAILRNPGLSLWSSSSSLSLKEEDDEEEEKKNVNVVGMTEVQKQWLKGFKKLISTINKERPSAVIVCGSPFIPLKYWKFLARIRDTIPVIWNEQHHHHHTDVDVVRNDRRRSKSLFYTFWLHGFQGLMLSLDGFSSKKKKNVDNDYEDDDDDEEEQMKWLQEQLEQVRMSKHQVFAILDGDPRNLPLLVLKRLARSRVLCLFGVVEKKTNDESTMEKGMTPRMEEDHSPTLTYTIDYSPNEKVRKDYSTKTRLNPNDDDDDDDDEITVKSTDSLEDDDDVEDCGMQVIITSSDRNGIDWLTVMEKNSAAAAAAAAASNEGRSYSTSFSTIE